MIELLAVEAVKGHRLNIVESAPRNEVEELAVRVRDIFSSQGWGWVAGWERGWGRGWRRGGADVKWEAIHTPPTVKNSIKFDIYIFF